MEFQNTNLKVLVANATSGAAETTLAAFKTDGDVGEVIAIDGQGGATAAGSTEIMIISKKADGSIDQSERIAVKGIRKINVAKYATELERIDYVGFDGAAGDIEVINDNLYQINVELVNFGSVSPESRYVKHGHYQSPAAATKAGVAEGLVKSLIRNQKREPYLRFNAGVVSAAAKSAAGTAGNLTFTEGSNIVTASAATASSNVVAGDLIFVGTTATSVGFVVASKDASGNLKLDQVFNRPTVTLVGTTNLRSAVANVAAGAIGIKIEGVPQPFVRGKVQFRQVDWNLSLVDFGSTTATHAQAPYAGVGVGKRVSELEWFATGNFGEHYRIGEPNLFEFRDELQTTTAGKYQVLTITYAHDQEAFVGTSSPRAIQVFANGGANGTTYTNINALITRLDVVNGISIGTLS